MCIRDSIPGAKAPKLVTDDMVAAMKPGSVLVDVAIDQGGCFEGSRPTTHADPTFGVHDAIYYCVANMPGAVPNTSTWALTNATLPYAVKLADKGWKGALNADAALALGLNTCLLYTSDAADERSSVDLGGRRIIKKKKNKKSIEVSIQRGHIDTETKQKRKE